ncbi:MAG TPA: adenylate/guanylate cyclase domain-containing protein [Polyangiaceae bacterium]|nr:adenylate/guanylate cyclase domain-containing protein [Polyangiaceae bacterium]
MPVQAHRPTRWDGSFVDRELERELAADQTESVERFLGFSLTVASVVFLAYGLHDALLVPAVREQAWAVRYGLFLPIALLSLWAVRSGRSLRFGQAAALAYGLAVNFVVLYVGAIAPQNGYLYTSYAVLFVTLGPFVARMNVVTQSAYTLATLTAYLVLELLLGKSSLELRISVASTLLSMGGIGALLALRQDRLARESFLQRRLIKEQVQAIALEQQRSEELLFNTLPPAIANRLKVEARSIADGFPQVSVLFADIVGFTRMSERLSPEDLVERLNLMFSSFDDLVDKLKLEKIKTIGDCYMVAGGLHSHEYDHAQTIAEMALGMKRRTLDFSRQFGEELNIRIGIHTGPVVAGVIGKRKFIYDVWGDTVNLASRMESHSEPGQIQVSEAMYFLLKDMYELTPRGDIEVKGKGKVRTWYLTDRASLGPDAQTRMPRKLAQN